MNYKAFCIIFLAYLIVACSSSDSPSDSNEIRLLENAKKSIDSLMYSIWDYGDSNAVKIVDANFNEQQIRTILNLTLARYYEIYEMAYVDSLGILKYIEPEIYQEAEGADISQQSHVIKLFETKKRVISRVFKLVEGYHAVVMESPIIKNNKCVGSVSPIFKPFMLIGSLLTEIKNNNVDDFFVMEDSGLLVYDTDETQIGRDVFTDSLYKPYPELITAANKILLSESGKTEYSFLDKEKNKTVRKDIWWHTSDYYGTKWKFCIVKERK